MNDLLVRAIEYIFFSLVTTFNQLFILLGPSMLLAFLMHYVSILLSRSAVLLFGPTFYIWGLKILGTPIHEIGHLIFALIFKHKIEDFKLFNPNPKYLTAGYVRHSYNPRSTYQKIGNFFIGIGPIIMGALVVYFFAWLLVGEEVLHTLQAVQINNEAFGSIESFGGLLNNLAISAYQILSALFKPENLKRWEFWLFLYILISVGTSITLSPSDIKGASAGFASIFGLVFLFNLLTAWVGSFATDLVVLTSQYLGSFYGLLVFSILLNLLVGLFLFLLTKLFPSLVRQSVSSMSEWLNR